MYTLFSDHTLSLKFTDNLEDLNLLASLFQKISCPGTMLCWVSLCRMDMLKNIFFHRIWLTYGLV